MSKIFGEDERLIVESGLDFEGDLEISMAVLASDKGSESVSTYIKEQDAKRLILHLEKVFDL